MDSPKWTPLAEFLQAEKLSEYIPTFSTLDLKAFSNLSALDIDKQVSPLYDRHRVMEAVQFARRLVSEEEGSDRDPLSKVTPTNLDPECMKTPTKLPTTSTPTKLYMTNAGFSKASLRPTKSLSPPMKLKCPPKRLSAFANSLPSCDSEEGSEDESKDRSGFSSPVFLDTLIAMSGSVTLPGRSAAISDPPLPTADLLSRTSSSGSDESNLVRLRRNLGSSDPSLSTADKSGENSEYQTYHRSRGQRRATEYRLSSGDFSPSHSPCPSPRALSPNRPAALPSHLYTSRRWSLVGSSDYFSGSPSSLSSASSQERLYHANYKVSDEDLGPHHQHAPLQRQPSSETKGRRQRARSLSPERQPDSSVNNETSFNIYKERFPQAKQEMEKKLENFIEISQQRSEGEVKGAANANFIHHRVREIAKDILDTSIDGKITDTYFEDVSKTLMRLMSDSERYSANSLPGETTGGFVTKEASELLKIISRSARLLECLTFSVGSFYTQIQEGTLDKMLRSTSYLPRYISSRLSTKFGGEQEVSGAVSQSGGSSGHSAHPSSSGTEDEGPDRSSQFTEEDFESRKLISNGAYGEVFLVKHRESKELFALKRIRKDRVIERSEVERAFMERDILSFVQNPFVVSMLCSFQTKTHLCMVLEYVEGGDLGTLLKNVGCLDTDQARMYHAEVVLALDYIHSYGIVHRDLKPENLLLTKEGHVKLTDFGLSKCGLMQMATRTYENSMAAFEDEIVGCIGTPDYIAPEVFNNRQYGFSVDWWSMGIILYQFLVGVVPFWGDSIQTLVECIISRQIEWPTEEDSVDPAARDLILGLLERNPVDRLGSGGAAEVQKHPFYQNISWDELIMHKAEFIPYLDSDEDTSYFDTRLDRYDHSISEDCGGPSDDACSNHIKYFDSVNWGGADHFIALSSPRIRNLSHDSVDSGTDNQPSISTDDGHSSEMGDASGHFHTSSPVRDQYPPLLHTIIREEQDGQITTDHRQTTTGHLTDLIRDLCTPVKVIPKVEPTVKSPEIPVFREQNKSEDSSHSSKDTSSKSSTGKLNLSERMNIAGLREAHVPEEPEAEEEEEEAGGKVSPTGERTVTLKKGGKGYGFTLTLIRVEGPGKNGQAETTTRHFVPEVVRGGAAEEAGLRQEDLILAVNGIPANPLSHKDLAEIIRSSLDQVELRVLNLSETSIEKRKRSTRRNKKKKRQSSFFKRATHATAGGSSMERFLHLSRSKTREKQNSDSDKSGGEQDSLVVQGHQLFIDPNSSVPSTAEEGAAAVVKPTKPFKHRFRRRPSNNFVVPVSPLARTPSPIGHNCYFGEGTGAGAPGTAGAERAGPGPKTPRTTTSQKTLHVTHPRTQSLSGLSKTPCSPSTVQPLQAPPPLSPASSRRRNQAAAARSPVTPRRQPSAQQGPSTRERKKSWVQGYGNDKDVL